MPLYTNKLASIVIIIMRSFVDVCDQRSNEHRDTINEKICDLCTRSCSNNCAVQSVNDRRIKKRELSDRT